MKRELVIQLQDGSARSLPLDGKRITVGRSADNDLAYPDDPILSRRHLALCADADEWWAEDLGSKNGTVVNGERLQGRRQLAVGDRIQAGRVTLVFDDPAQISDRTVVFVPDDFSETQKSTSVSVNLREVLGDGNGLEAALKAPALAGTFHMQALLAAGAELDLQRPLPELFSIILDLSVRSVGATRGVVMILEDGQLVPRAALGDSFRISGAVRDRVLQKQESLLVTDANQDAALRGSATIAQQRIRSLIAVPLQTKDQVIGLLYLDSPEIVRPFTQQDLTLLTVMANIAAIRIENARLAEVEEAERLLKKELEQAADIQRNLLPKQAPQVDGLELAGLSAACRSVGGDYFDYMPLSDGRIAVMCGDVAGKGMSAALLMSSLQARVQVLCEESRDMAELMTRINRSVAASCPGNRFITFFMCLYNPATGELDYSNAGHNPPYLLRGGGAVETLETGGPVLGVLKNFRYQSARTELFPGDLLVMFSDGVTEARASSDEEYGEERLLGELGALRGVTAGEVVREVFQSVERFMGDEPAGDDITVVAARRV
jgi:serine phosphatase RsbU (regulator of sigma subunit)/pSer/pThr/pTyr-binding forkhead associated (FHA) protein